MTTIRIGTCSWADEALSKYFYPPGTPSGERLPYYAQHFDTVEVDSTYYRLPVPEMVERWAERTPDDFVFHVKAFGVMTRHPVKLEQLPTDLRDDAPKVDAKNVPPTVLAVTSPIADVRMHGRNEKTWNVRGRSAAERFDYLYSDEELEEWVEPLQELAQQGEQVFLVFNNNNRSPSGDGGFVAQASTNALTLRKLLAEARVPVS